MYLNFVFILNLNFFVANGNMNGIVEFEPSTDGAATSKPLISPGVCGNSANNRRKVCKSMFLFICQLKLQISIQIPERYFILQQMFWKLQKII